MQATAVGDDMPQDYARRTVASYVYREYGAADLARFCGHDTALDRYEPVDFLAPLHRGLDDDAAVESKRNECSTPWGNGLAQAFAEELAARVDGERSSV